jgi:hypothetical protein
MEKYSINCTPTAAAGTSVMAMVLTSNLRNTGRVDGCLPLSDVVVLLCSPSSAPVRLHLQIIVEYFCLIRSVTAASTPCGSICRMTHPSFMLFSRSPQRDPAKASIKIINDRATAILSVRVSALKLLEVTRVNASVRP